jgi:hypothetical protein
MLLHIVASYNIHSINEKHNFVRTSRILVAVYTSNRGYEHCSEHCTAYSCGCTTYMIRATTIRRKDLQAIGCLGYKAWYATGCIAYIES